MTLDPRIKDAILQVAGELNQETALPDKLIAWLESVIDGNETLDDRPAVSRRLGLLFESVAVEIDE